MGLRPNSCYRDIQRAYTRYATRVQKKDFIGGIPGVRIRQFVMGNQTKDFDWVLDLKANESMQIRDNAIEALRQKLTKQLNDQVGKDNWTLKIRIYPFHILRENKAASGAGADRVSSGMKHAFGKNIGRAAQVRKNDIILSLVVNTDHLDKARQILKNSKYKINIGFDVLVSKHENKRLSGRKRWTREARIKAAEAPKEEVKTPATKGKAAPAAKPAKKAA